MYLELYQQETEKLAKRNGKLLDELHNKLSQLDGLSMIEEQAILHALQVLIENAIGKARHLLKTQGEKVPISAYELFELLRKLGLINAEAQQGWEKNYRLKKHYCA